MNAQLRELIAKWRDQCEMHGMEWDAGYNRARTTCADELEAALAAPKEAGDAQALELAAQFEWWLRFNAASHEHDGTAVHDDMHVTPPEWPRRGNLKKWIEILRRLAAPSKEAGPSEDVSTLPHPRWNAEKPASERHPQSVDVWDWRKDSHENDSLDRSLRRLAVAADYGDPRAPDQMAMVLRIDLIRVNSAFTWCRTQRDHFQQKAEALANPPGDQRQEGEWLRAKAAEPAFVKLTEHHVDWDEFGRRALKYFAASPPPEDAAAVGELLDSVIGSARDDQRNGLTFMSPTTALFRKRVLAALASPTGVDEAMEVDDGL